MRFIVGLILTPVGAIVATLCLAVGVLVANKAFDSWIFSLDLAGIVAAITVIYGFAYVAPITLIGLPVAYERLRVRSALTVGRLAKLGVAFAVVLMWCWEIRRGNESKYKSRNTSPPANRKSAKHRPPPFEAT